MYKETNDILKDILSQSALSEYKNLIESIQWDFNNMKFLINFLSSGDLTVGVENAIDDMILEKYGKKAYDEYDNQLLKDLTDFHSKNYEDILLQFYNCFNIVDDTYESILFNHVNEHKILVKDVKFFLDELQNLADTCIITSDFFLNVCAIYKVRLLLLNQIDDKFVKKEISFNFNDFTNKLKVIGELKHVLNKINKLLYAYNDMEYEEPDELSIYDLKKLTNTFLIFGYKNINNFIEDYINSSKIKKYDIHVYYLNYFILLFNSILNEQKHMGNIDKHLNSLYYGYSSVMSKQFKRKEKSIYNDLIFCLNSLKNIFSNSDVNLENWFDKLVDGLYNEFVTNVGEIDKKTFKIAIVSDIQFIRKALSDIGFVTKSNIESLVNENEQEFVDEKIYTCGACGIEVLEDAVFCPNCGANFEDDD